LINTDFDESIPLITHQVDGDVSLADISAAMTRTVSFHELHNAAVLWDLRKATFQRTSHETQVLGIARLIELMKDHMSDRKRAFVVSQQPQLEFLDNLIGATTAPWPWAVFMNVEDARLWVSS